MSSPASHVPEGIKENEALVAELDIEVEAYEVLFAQRQARHEGLLAIVDEPQCLIDQLPFEILALIFMCFMEYEHYPTGYHSEYYRDPPPKRPPVLTLLTVCREWKSIAYGTPGIWSHITIVLASNGGKRSPELMEPLMERAGAYPLTFVMDVRPGLHHADNELEKQQQGQYEAEVNHLLELLERLKPNFNTIQIRGVGPCTPSANYRWRSLFVLFGYLAKNPQATRIMTAFRLWPTAFQTGLGNPFASNEAQIIGAAFPMFNALTLLQIPAGFLQPSCPSLTRIKDLQITNDCDSFGREGNNIFSIIQTCSAHALESLTITFVDFPDASPAVKLTLLRLRRLVLKNCDRVRDVFERLQVPMLQDLTLAHGTMDHRREYVYRLVFKTLFEQETGAPRLTKLSIFGFQFLGIDITAWILERLPTLRELTIHNHQGLSAKLLAALCEPPKGHKGLLCPDLQRLDLDRTYKIDTSQLAQIFGARSAKQAEALGNGEAQGVEPRQGIEVGHMHAGGIDEGRTGAGRSDV